MQSAAAAKSLQSCPILHDPIDGSPPGSPVPGILQARVLELVAIAFSVNAEYIMWNARMDESQDGIKIAGRNINNLRYADDTILLQKVKRNLKASWWKWKKRVKKVA